MKKTLETEATVANESRGEFKKEDNYPLFVDYGFTPSPTLIHLGLINNIHNRDLVDPLAVTPPALPLP